jgi:RNA polymerase sigma-70 factor, ECF subfamily
MPQSSVSQLLARHRQGEAGALDRVLPLVYDELRALARAQLRREDAGHTLGATALVHEAYLRLAGGEEIAPDDRRHFFAIAARAMRRVLIDHARGRNCAKRGAGDVALQLSQVEEFLQQADNDEAAALDEALERLSQANPRAAQVIEYHFFAGFTLQETADALAVSVKTVQRDWMVGRAWLASEIERDRQGR